MCISPSFPALSLPLFPSIKLVNGGDCRCECSKILRSTLLNKSVLSINLRSRYLMGRVVLSNKRLTFYMALFSNLKRCDFPLVDYSTRRNT